MVLSTPAVAQESSLKTVPFVSPEIVGQLALAVMSDVTSGVTGFKICASGATIAVEWATQPGFRVAQFELERSRDCLQFESVASLACVHNRYAVTKYNTTDPTPWAGYTYYRLKLVEDAGTVAYVGPVASFLPIKNLTLAPNPWDGRQQLSVSASLAEDAYYIAFLDLHGRHVYEMPLRDSYFSLPEDRFAPGLYYYKIYSALQLVGHGKWKVEK